MMSRAKTLKKHDHSVAGQNNLSQVLWVQTRFCQFVAHGVNAIRPLHHVASRSLRPVTGRDEPSEGFLAVTDVVEP